MKTQIITNIVLVVSIAALSYAATIFFDQQNPPVQTAPQSINEPLKTAQTVPEFSFKDKNGKTHTTKDLRGKTVILNFWASWCTPCIKEMPALIKAAQTNPDNIVFIGLSSDLEEKTMLRFIDRLYDKGTNPYTKNIFFALDSENITQNLFQTYRLPETILIDKNQIMRTKFIGANWAYEELIKAISDIQSVQ